AAGARQSAIPYDQESVADTVAEQLRRIGNEHGPRPRRRSASAAASGHVRGATDRSAMASRSAKRWIMITSPMVRCGVRETTAWLTSGLLGDKVTVLSCPETFRDFDVAADLLHLQYHPAFVDADDLCRFPPSGVLVATVHDTTGFEKVAHLFDAIIVHNERDRRRMETVRRKRHSELRMIPLGCCGAAAEGFQPSAHGAPVIGFHGFLSGNKRLKELIHATAELARSYSKC